jgi:hypothetical protein
MNREQERRLTEAVIELRESNKSISESMRGINENLRILNDQNILHTSNNTQEHKTILTSLQLLTGKYWWLIMVLLVIVLIVMGYKEAVGILIEG